MQTSFTPLMNSLKQVRQANPVLVDQLSAEIANLCQETLLDFEGLLTEHLDLNVFSASKHLVGSVEILARTISELTGKPIEQVLLEVRYGKWEGETVECRPDWARPNEFTDITE